MVPVCRSDSTRVSDQEDWVDAFNLPAPQPAPPVARFQRIQRWRWNELREKLAYRYFCWRFGPLLKLPWLAQYAQLLLCLWTADSPFDA